MELDEELRTIIMRNEDASKITAVRAPPRHAQSARGWLAEGPPRRHHGRRSHQSDSGILMTNWLHCSENLNTGLAIRCGAGCQPAPDPPVRLWGPNKPARGPAADQGVRPTTGEALTMATAYFFRAIASDGKVRTGTLTAETERLVASELRRQGLTPVYVGAEQKKGIELNLPAFDRGKRHDVLFFTQELSTLLNAGVPLDRALGITAELTERGNFRSLVIDVVRILKGGKSLADSLAAHPTHFSELYINMVRAGEASGSLAQIFERLSEFERTRDDLRGYIISSLIYPVLLTLVGIASIFTLLNFVVPRFALIFSDPRMKIPTPTLLLLEASRLVQDWWLPVAVVLAVAILAFRRTSGPPPAASGGIRSGCASPCWAMRCAKPKPLASRAPWGRWFRPACLWFNPSASRAAS